jgi:hypothetical protein
MSKVKIVGVYNAPKVVNIQRLNQILKPRFEVKFIDSWGVVELSRWIIWQNEKELMERLNKEFDIKEFFDFEPDIENDRFISNGGFILKNFKYEKGKRKSI